MNAKVVLPLVLLATAFATGMADTCQTCLGSECNVRNVPEVACSEEAISILPFDFESRGVNHMNPTFACLKLEYVQDEEAQQLRQCVSLDDDEDICSEIRSSKTESIVVKSCAISPTKSTIADDLLEEGLLLAVEDTRAIAPEDDEEGSGGDGGDENSAAGVSVSVVTIVGAFMLQFA